MTRPLTPGLMISAPAKGRSGRSVAKPRAVAAADCACPLTSRISTTGQPIIWAISALEPMPVSPFVATPSNRPIDPSARTRSAGGWPVTWAISRPGSIAQASRLKLARPEAARWNPGSM